MKIFNKVILSLSPFIQPMQKPVYEGKLIIGSKEKISFPNQKRKNIVARIDSGAKSTAVHCDKIWIETMAGKKVLCCHFLKRSHKVVRFTDFKRRTVKSSNGTRQTRYVVSLLIKLAGVEKRTLVTLTDRSTMNYTVLLGRRFLKDDFLVDVSASYIQTDRILQKEKQTGE